MARPVDALIKGHEPPQPTTQVPLINRQAEAAGVSTPPSPPSVYSSAKSSPGHQQRASFDDPVIEAAAEPGKEAAVVTGAPGTDLLASAMGLISSRADSGQGLSGAGMGRQRSMLPSSSAKLAHLMLRVQEAPQKAGSSSLSVLSMLAIARIIACCWRPGCKRIHCHLEAKLLTALLIGFSNAASADVLCAAGQVQQGRQHCSTKYLCASLFANSSMCLLQAMHQASASPEEIQRMRLALRRFPDPATPPKRQGSAAQQAQPKPEAPMLPALSLTDWTDSPLQAPEAASGEEVTQLLRHWQCQSYQGLSTFLMEAAHSLMGRMVTCSQGPAVCSKYRPQTVLLQQHAQAALRALFALRCLLHS